MEQPRSVGASVPRLEGVLKVRGRARFGADEVLPGMLWCAFVRSPLAHARVARIDVSRAENVGGGFATIRLALECDGHITLETGLPDTGTGALTVLRQVLRLVEVR